MLIPTDAHAALADLVAGYRAGLRDLLPFALETSHTYCELRHARRKPLSAAAAREQARRVWSQASAARGAPPPECAQPAHRVAWPAPASPVDHDAFVHWAETVWRPLVTALEGGRR